MKKISVVALNLILLCLVLPTAWAESLAEKKQWHKELSEIVENPNVFWLPTSIFMRDHELLSVNQVKDNITKNILSNPVFNNHYSREFFEQYVRVAFRQAVALSNETKQLAKETLLPALAAEIKEADNQWEPWQEGDTDTAAADEFSNFLTELNSPEHLESVDFMQRLDQSASDSGQESYATCPEFNPKRTKCWRAYVNEGSGGDTYTECCYFGGNESHIYSEQPFFQGKKDGTSLHWNGRSSGTYYFAKRKNWKDDQLHGIYESYSWSPQIGGPYLRSVFQYNQGEKSGHSVQYRVSGERTETIWLRGVSEKIYYYNKDGSLRRSGTKDHDSGRWIWN